MEKPNEWREAIQQAYLERDAELRDRFSRSLPLQDSLDDRWERAFRLGFGEGTSVYNSAFVFGDVRVGKGTWIGPNVMLEGGGGTLEIGDTCSISSGVQIYTHDTIAWALSGGRLEARYGAVKIGSRTYIGSQCIISAGVTIGSGCVIAANSLVNQDVADGIVMGGTPARRLGRVEFRDDLPFIVYDSGGETCLTKP